MFKRFINDSSGNIAMMFATVGSVVLIAVGAAIDFAGLSDHKSKVQDNIDAATLAAAALETNNKKEIRQFVKDFLDETNTTGLPIDVKVKFTQDRIISEGTSDYPTLLMGMVGYSKLTAKVHAEAPRRTDAQLHLALALDTTGSMGGDNIKALRNAAQSLVTTLSKNTAKVNISVVPFATYVNVGKKYRDENWLDAPTELSSRREDKWQGCVGSRKGNDNLQPAYSGRKIPGLIGVSCGQNILPLTRNFDKVKTKIGELNAEGATYIPSGLMWAWRTLDPRPPFDEAASLRSTNLTRAMVLMTDGENTRSLGTWTTAQRNSDTPYAYHEGGDGAAADAHMLKLCAQIKTDDIQVFTIAYKFEGGDAARTRAALQTCATSSAHFYDAKNESELRHVFENIGKSLFTVRLTR